MATKYTIHIIQNSHTDLGYTHRQEYVYRAHARYLDYAIAMAKKDPRFKYTLENFWMYENYCKWNKHAKVQELNNYIAKGNIEITANYLNLLNILDRNAYANKVQKLKAIFPEVQVAIQQDVNAVSKQQALILYQNGVKYLFASIHTHHGMFAGKGKQRGFIWNLGNKRKIVVWAGEHYMLGNELGIHLGIPNRYVFKDDIDLEKKTPIESGAKRLHGYLKLLEVEGYDQHHIPIVVSGSVIDNSPPSIRVVEGVRRLNKAMGLDVEVKLSTIDAFFASIDKQKLPELKGEWPSWWIDGAISTPETLRQYREAQVLYKNIKVVNFNGDGTYEHKLEELENNLLMFAEHTWGSWSSQSDPFANGNNLLLSRKKTFATNASTIAWNLWDQVKENDGYNIVKVDETNVIVVKNIHNKRLQKVIAVQLPRHLRGKTTCDRYLYDQDILDIVDEQDRKYNYVITKKMGLSDNFNTSIESDDIILVATKLEPLQKLELTLKERVTAYRPRTSSYLQIGVDNVNDVAMGPSNDCKYIQNGIENKFYKIIWNLQGITSVFDKEANRELLIAGKAINFVRVLSDDPRHLFGRNRQGPSATLTSSRIISHKVVHNKPNGIIVKLACELVGTRHLELAIRITTLEKSIRLQAKFLKDGFLKAENMYLAMPFQHKSIMINSGSEWFTAGLDQLPATNLDYYSCDKGVIFKNEMFSTGITMHDTPLLQTGSLKFEPRQVMGESWGKMQFNPLVWLMTNYWETNYKGSLEGCFAFAFDIFSDQVQRRINDSHRNVIAYNVWK